MSCDFGGRGDTLLCYGKKAVLNDLVPARKTKKKAKKSKKKTKA